MFAFYVFETSRTLLENTWHTCQIVESHRPSKILLITWGKDSFLGVIVYFVFEPKVWFCRLEIVLLVQDVVEEDRELAKDFHTKVQTLFFTILQHNTNNKFCYNIWQTLWKSFKTCEVVVVTVAIARLATWTLCKLAQQWHAALLFT